MVTVMETKRPSLLGCFFTGSSLKGATWRAMISATAAWKPGSSLPMIFTGKVVGNFRGEVSLTRISGGEFHFVLLEEVVHTLPVYARLAAAGGSAVQFGHGVDLAGGAGEPDLLGLSELGRRDRRLAPGQAV